MALGGGRGKEPASVYHENKPLELHCPDRPLFSGPNRFYKNYVVTVGIAYILLCEDL